MISRILVALGIWWLAVQSWAAEDPSVSRILYLGDSLSLGPFGQVLDQYLRAGDLEVHTYVTGSGSPYYWLEKHTPISASIGAWEKTPERERREDFVIQVPKLETLLRSIRPQVILVQAGTQLYPFLAPDTEERRTQLGDLMDEFCRKAYQSRARLYWVLPPDAHPQRVAPELQSELGDIIQDRVSRYQGQVFASREATEWSLPYPGSSDGIHYGKVEARQWAEAVAADFQGYLTRIAQGGLPLVAQASERSIVPPNEGEEEGAERPPAMAPIPARLIAPVGPARATDELQVKLVLREKSVIEEPGEVGGPSAFGVFEYDVEKVYQGSYPHSRLRVAHMLVLNHRLTAPNQFAVGKEYYLTLVNLNKYPTLAQIEMVDQLEPDEDLPVYICKF